MTMTAENEMFDDVRPGSSPLEDGRYILKVVKLEPAEGQFGKQIKWYFNVADAASKAIIRDSTGEPYEWFGYTSTKTSPGTKANTWATAFLNRELEIGESGSQLARDLLGKKAIAMVGPSGPNQRTSILSIKPFAATAAAPPPPPVTDDLDEL